MRSYRIAGAVLALAVGTGCADLAGVNGDYQLPAGCVPDCSTAIDAEEYPCDADAAHLFDELTDCAKRECATTCGMMGWPATECAMCFKTRCDAEYQDCMTH